MAKITFSLTQLEALISRAITVGKVEMISQYLPQSDLVSRPTLIGYLKIIGLDASTLRSWEERDLIHVIQSGQGGTHKYSRRDVQKLLLKMEVSKGKIQ